MKHQDDLIKYRVSKAYKALDDAIYNADGKKWDTATNRIYYAMFYAVNALLLKLKLSAKTHKGVHNLFFVHFIKPGIFPDEFGKFYSEIFDNRMESDYDDEPDYDYTLIPLWIEKARDFIKAIDEYLNK